MRTVALIVAAGRGERLGAGLPKQYRHLAGRTVLRHAVEAFARHPRIDGGVRVAIGAGDAAAYAAATAGLDLLPAVQGGGSRQETVRLGLESLAELAPERVLIHDAARPLVEVELVEAVTQRALATGAALPVLPLVDTVKRVRGGRVVETLDRSELGGAQTPQGFRMALLREALEAATRAGLELTDEAMAVERLGHAVDAVPGSKRNRKLTTPDDLAWAEGVVAGILRM